jgi:hypothetical protein
MIQILYAIPMALPFVVASVAAFPLPIRKPLRLRCHKRGGMWFFRVGKLGGSFYLSSK